MANRVDVAAAAKVRMAKDEIVDVAMELVKPLGVKMTLIDEDAKQPGYAEWTGGESFQVRMAMSAARSVTVRLSRGDETLRAFNIGLEDMLGVFAGDSFTLDGAGPVIAANIYEMIEEGVFLDPVE